MTKLETVPRGLDEILDLYGDPRGANGELDQAWYRRCTEIFRLPYQMRTWNGRRTEIFRAHVLVGPVIEDTMAEITARMTRQTMQRERWDFWGGCWNYRPMRGYDALSTHAWGIAFDLNPERAPLGGKPEDQHPVIAQTCKEAGFKWGGDWLPPWRNDSQHFQAATGY